MSLHSLARQPQFNSRRTSPAPANRTRAPKLSTHPANTSRWPSNRLPAYVQQLGALSHGMVEANDMVQMLRRQVVLDLSVGMGAYIHYHLAESYMEICGNCIARAQTSGNYVNIELQALVSLLATAGGTVRNDEHALSCISQPWKSTHTSKATTSPLCVTVTHSTRSLRTTVPLLSARNRQSSSANQHFLCSEKLWQYRDGLGMRSHVS